MSDLLSLQQTFVELVSTKLIPWAIANGYAMTFGEAWRSPEEAAIQAAKGAGVAHSLHTERLAVDLNLFRGRQILLNLEDYRPIGEYWKTLHPLARWGGDFKRVDADHFSLTFGGVE
jgi:hypothetical protein